MTTYRVPLVIKGFAIVKYAEGKATGDYLSRLPRDAEREACNNTPHMCGARMEGCIVELAGAAEVVAESAPAGRSARV